MCTCGRQIAARSQPDRSHRCCKIKDSFRLCSSRCVRPRDGAMTTHRSETSKQRASSALLACRVRWLALLPACLPDVTSYKEEADEGSGRRQERVAKRQRTALCGGSRTDSRLAPLLHCIHYKPPNMLGQAVAAAIALSSASGVGSRPSALVLRPQHRRLATEEPHAAFLGGGPFGFIFGGPPGFLAIGCSTAQHNTARRSNNAFVSTQLLNQAMRTQQAEQQAMHLAVGGAPVARPVSCPLGGRPASCP